MFPPFPHLENVGFHLHVNWCEQERPVEVRLKCWPKSHKATVVCRFEDDPEYSDWIVTGQENLPYLIANPYKITFNQNVFDIATRQPLFGIKDTHLKKLRRLVRRAFEGENFHIARVLSIDDLPKEPYLVIWSHQGAFWWKDWRLEKQELTPFEWSPTPTHLSDVHMIEILKLSWDEPTSESRFAWEWFHWSSEERMRRFTGFSGEAGELTQVMTWILSVTRRLWELDEGWSWNWRPGIEEPLPHSSSYNHSYDWQIMQVVEEENLFGKWEQMLQSHFFPALRRDWFKQHQCVRLYWRGTIAEVSLNSPPSMHEQLEARLLLQEWLETNAPDRMDLLPS